MLLITIFQLKNHSFTVPMVGISAIIACLCRDITIVVFPHCTFLLSKIRKVEKFTAKIVFISY